MNRSEVRHALYRIQKGIPVAEKQALYEQLEPLIPPGETWATFSTGWDVFVKQGTITVIIPEIDYEFIHTTCLEKSIRSSMANTDWMTHRQMNVIQIVELNMLEQMTWPTYNKTWAVSVDRELKKITTRLFKTSVNKVSPEMIEASKKSDGAALTQVPSIPTVVLSKSQEMQPKEIEEFLKQHKV